MMRRRPIPLMAKIAATAALIVAVEAVIAAVQGDRRNLVLEAADVLYHLVVLLRAGGVGLDEVMAELERRTAQSGIAEKAARRQT